jgi:hypothetical protein
VEAMKRTLKLRNAPIRNLPSSVESTFPLMSNPTVREAEFRTPSSVTLLRVDLNFLVLSPKRLEKILFP